MWLRPLVFLRQQVVLHRPLQRRVASVPVETRRAEEALSLVSLRLLLRVERQRINALGRVLRGRFSSLGGLPLRFGFNRHGSPLSARVIPMRKFVHYAAIFAQFAASPPASAFPCTSPASATIPRREASIRLIPIASSA